MKKIIFLILLFAVYETLLAGPQEKFYFDVDHTIFRSSDSKSTLELYFGFIQKLLTFSQKEGTFEAQANIEITIIDKKTNNAVFSDVYGLKTTVNDTAHAKLNSKLIGQQNFRLPPGDFRINLIGSDFYDRKRTDSINFDISIPVKDESKTGLSDIQVASSIEKSSDQNSIFYKNGLEVTPNPNLLFGKKLNKVFYYVEIYDLKKTFAGDSTLLTASITDLSSNVIFTRSKYLSSRAGAFADIGSFQIDSLDSSPYLLELKLTDKGTGAFISGNKKFFVYNTGAIIISTNSEDRAYLKSEYASMSENYLNLEFDKTIYIRSSAEIDEFGRLQNIEAKRKYMYNFWKRRNSNPNSPVNTYKEDYMKRVTEASKYYRQGFMEGWKTDRGRIYITYGRPTDVDSYPYEAETKAYEIWNYSTLEGGTMCVFIEKQLGSGYYALVHSTIRKELRNDNWKAELKK